MEKRRKENLDRAFKPRVIAVVGDKGSSDYNWLRNMMDATKNGTKLYSVQVDERETPGIQALGITNLKSLREVPEPIDYVLCAVPRKFSPLIVKDCADLKVGALALFTSGFAETHEEMGAQLQDEVVRIAREADLNLIGPNCLGLYNAAAGIRCGGRDQFVGEGGRVSFISSSGTHATSMTLGAYQAGILPAKGVSMGNAVVVDVADWLEYLGQDPQTEIIAMYIEGVRDGRKFFTTLREVAARKPVLIWKGGQTPDGARAATSHTAALAQPMTLWDAMIRQVGAIRVDDIEDVVNTLKALCWVKPPRGPRLGLMTMTGGPSVIFSDACAKQGLTVPPLTEESYQRLSPWFTVVGGSYQNPLDYASSFTSVEVGRQMLDILNEDDNIDGIIQDVGIAMGFRRNAEPDFSEKVLDMIQEFKGQTEKPYMAVMTGSGREREALDFRPRLAQRQIACFATYADAARTMRRLLDYYANKATLAAEGSVLEMT
ncbi:MAG: CoA-binding protein [Chloroflexi bacterium]|nr:CoA-binding protein [Chloroflexota bacterium]